MAKFYTTIYRSLRTPQINGAAKGASPLCKDIVQGNFYDLYKTTFKYYKLAYICQTKLEINNKDIENQYILIILPCFFYLLTDDNDS